MGVPGGGQTLAYLLDLDGEEIIYDGGYVARFKVERIAATPEKPHGISYSLTFHATDGRRLMGYDNAHGVPHRGGRFVRRRAAFDHWHRDETESAARAGICGVGRAGVSRRRHRADPAR